MDARAANDRIADKAEQLQFVSRVPMLCECSRPACRTTVMISLGDYRQIRKDSDNFLTAPGHHIDGANAGEGNRGLRNPRTPPRPRRQRRPQICLVS
jgi:hypothetical protein